MTEVLPLPTGLFGKSSSTEELNTLHAWPSDPRLAPPAISTEDQRDLQQISRFRERIEREIEVRMEQCTAVYDVLRCVGSEAADKKNGTGFKSSAGIRADNSTCRKVRSLVVSE